MSASLEEQVIAMIASRRNLPPDTITPRSTFAEIGVDSLDAIELVFKFEDTFHITITDEAVQRMRTVEDVIVTLRTALAGGATSAP